MFCFKMTDPPQETNAMEGLEHPNILRLYHSFSDGGYPCMIVEYCAGGLPPFAAYAIFVGI